MKDGDFIIYCIQHRRVKETPWLKPNALLQKMKCP